MPRGRERKYPRGTWPKTSRYDQRVSIAPPGAVGGKLKKQLDPSFSGIVPDPFDWRNIIAAPASGTLSVILGTIAGVQAAQPTRVVPPKTRGVVYGICPYLEMAAGGRVPVGRIPGAGVTIEWKVYAANRPLGDYGTITDICSDWDDRAERPILELPEGYTLSATVRNTDPNGLYSFLGLRIWGRFIPWDGKEATRE